MARHPERLRRAFSLIEVVVVCVLIGVLVGVVAPRFSNVTSRRGEASVREFAELLSAAATRDQLTGQAVAVDYDSETRQARLFVPDIPEGESSGHSTVRASGAAGWRPDPISRPVELDGVLVVEATQDFAELDVLRWRVEFPRTEPRPRLVVMLQQEGGEQRWAIVLSPTGTRAVVVPPELATQDSDSIDLDATGKSISAW